MAPPEAPTLSAFPLSGGGPENGAPQASKIGAIPKIVFQIEMLLDTLARAMPGAAQQVDQAKAVVRGILTKSIPSGGGTGTQSVPPPGMGGGMGGPGGYTP